MTTLQDLVWKHWCAPRCARSEVFGIPIECLLESPTGEQQVEKFDATFDNLIETLSESIRTLFKTSGIARKAATRDKYALALKKIPASHVTDEDVDFERIGDLFPRLRLSKYDWQRTRLAKANNLRRRYLQYCEEHQAGVEAGTSRGNIVVPEKELPNSVDEVRTEKSSQAAESTATTVNAAALEAATAEKDDAQSIVSAFSYATDSATPMRYRVVDLGDVNNGQENFRNCPYCKDEHLYSTINEFKTHLQQEHQSKFYKRQLPQICEISEQEPADIPASTCPFYDWQTKLEYRNRESEITVTLQRYRRHIGSHLEQAALAVLEVEDAEDSDHSEHSFDEALDWNSDTAEVSGQRDEVGSETLNLSSAELAIHNLDRLYKDQGKYEVENEMNRRALEGYEKVLGREHPDTLIDASSGGHMEIVQRLLDHQADINAQGGYFGNALRAASSGGHTEIVQLLLNHQADVNAQGGHYGDALQAASSGGHTEIIQLLLDHQADINVQGGYFGNALQAASYKGHTEIVQLLLDHQADVNAQGGKYGTTLQAALSRGYTEIV
ncbi:hypothetical protein LTR95_015472 [Oleoguttula sp. CCFEE 5521]